MINVYQSISLSKSQNGSTVDEIEMKLLDVIAGMVVSVDDTTDPVLIKQWMDALPAGWLSKLAEHTTGIGDWGVNASVKCICKDCNEEMTIEVPINPVGFFT